VGHAQHFRQKRNSEDIVTTAVILGFVLVVIALAAVLYLAVAAHWRIDALTDPRATQRPTGRHHPRGETE
jgi:hypothetical protein